MTTLLCVPIMVEDFADAAADAAMARDLGADIVEYRLDRAFDTLDDEHAVRSIEALIAQSPLPCIATCRPTWEGGEYDGDDDERISLFERLGLAESPPKYIDVELAALSRSANLRQKVRLAVEHAGQRKDLSTELLLSMHDFDGRPADLLRKLVAMQDEDAARVVKVAYRARTIRDNLELLDIHDGAHRPTISLGMGEFGLLSRVLAPKFGGFLTFASLDDGKATAPGQPTVREMIDLYRVRSISRTTKVYGVVGWPVSHSLSPLVHNAGFEAVGHDGMYLPLPTPAGEDLQASDASFKATMLELIEHPRLDLAGLSVTLPHKQRLVSLAQQQGWQLDPFSSQYGSANTVTIDRSGGPVSVAVANTDATAAVACVRDHLQSLDGRSVVILGAGGVARAIAFAFATGGASVHVTSRRIEQAQSLAAELDTLVASAVCAADDIAAIAPDVLVNATPVGMSSGPAPSDMPISRRTLESLSDGTVVFETVYSPVETPLVNASRERGLSVIDGASMFVRQAVEQSRLWTGIEPPISLFDRIVREHLAAASSG